MVVVDGGQEGGLGGDKVLIVKILDQFAFGNFLEEDAVCLVWVRDRWILLSGGERDQWDVPQTIGTISQACNYDLVVLQDVHVIFGEDGDAVVVAELTHGDE